MKTIYIINKQSLFQAYFLFFILIGSTVNAQTTIWSENFESYVDGSTVAVDNNTANPAIDWSFGSGSTINKVFGTNPISGSLSFYNRKGTSTWTTEVIDISAYTDVSIFINLNEITCETGDKIETYYNLDNTGPIEFGDGNGDAGFNNISNYINSLNGESLILTVVTTSDAINDKHKFDDILIQGILNLSIEDINLNDNEKKQILIYPNPTTDKIKIEAERIKNIKVLNIEGKQIYSGNEKEIDLSKEPIGIYVIKVITEKQAVSRKLIKK